MEQYSEWTLLNNEALITVYRNTHHQYNQVWTWQQTRGSSSIYHLAAILTMFCSGLSGR